MYRVKKVINNNFISSIDQNGKQVIIRGLGIGFQKKTGEWIKDDKVEAVYRIDDKATSNKLQELVSQVPKEYIDTCTEIIDNIKLKLNKKLNDNIYITLTDHLSFAIERKKLKQEYSNALLWDIKRFYDQEYKLGLESLDIIEKKHNVRLSDDEAGFIALHIVNAELDTNMSSMIKITSFMQEVLEIVRNYYDIELNEDSLDFGRFITHLKYFAQRLFNNKPTKDTDFQLQRMIRENYSKDYGCAEKIKEYIKEKYNLNLTGEEMMFLTIHLKRISTN
ncbi:MAG: BglG family transcription antiterminator LicT [Intestinibacter sp.]|uniref:BglG family transcription antiterminator LicT n=1 Tax=Intestinibacter sp. TaxID=1965304 RepID=UPI003F165ED1